MCTICSLLILCYFFLLKQVEASADGESWDEVRPQSAPNNLVFEGNINYATRKDNFFADDGITARFIRVTPIHWVGPTAAMRVCLIMERMCNDITCIERLLLLVHL